MSGQQAGPSGQAAGGNGRNGTGHLHHHSWGSDEWQGLLSTYFGAPEDAAQPSDVPSLRHQLSDGKLVSDLLQSLEAGDDKCGLDPNGGPIFSQKTINAIMADQMRETAAQTGQQQPAVPDVPATLQHNISDASMLADLVQSLEGGDDGYGLDLSAPIFSEKTINAIMGDQMREMAAQVMRESQQQQQPQPAAAKPSVPSNGPLRGIMGPGPAALMTMHEATNALQTAQVTAPPVAAIAAMAPQTVLLNPMATLQHATAEYGVSQHAQIILPGGMQVAHQHQQQQQQTYVTLLDGRMLQQPDGTAVLANLPAGQQQVHVPIAGSASVLQYVPVLESRVVPVTTGPAQQQQQIAQQQAQAQAQQLHAAQQQAQQQAQQRQATADVSTTQELVAAAAGVQQQLIQEASSSGLQRQPSAPEAACAAMAEAAAAMAEFSAPMDVMSGGASDSAHGGIQMAMPPPPPRQPQLYAESDQQQSSLLTPQLRPATTAPFPQALASAVAAAAADSSHPLPTLRPAGTEAHAAAAAAGTELEQALSADGAFSGGSGEDLMDDGALPRRPSHKRERSLRSAVPLLADPSTAPCEKLAKGTGEGEEGGGTGGTGGTPKKAADISGTSPDSPCYNLTGHGRGVLHSSSSGEASPLPLPPPVSTVAAAAAAAANAAAALVLTPSGMYDAAHSPETSRLQALNLHAQGPTDSTAATAATAALSEGTTVSMLPEDSAALAALIDSTLAPKPGKRRGRPPGKSRYALAAAAVAAAADAAGAGAEPSDSEILEKLLSEDPSRRCLPAEELKKMVRREKNKISAAVSRQRSQVYTAQLEDRVRRLEAEAVALSGWLHGPPQVPPHRVLMTGGAGESTQSSPPLPLPPIRHLSL